MTEWVTAAAILGGSGAPSSPSPADEEWAEMCAAALNAGIDDVLSDVLADGTVTGTEPEVLWLARIGGTEAYKRREAVFAITGYVDLQGTAIRVARDYLEGVRPILARYASPGLA